MKPSRYGIHCATSALLPGSVNWTGSRKWLGASVGVGAVCGFAYGTQTVTAGKQFGWWTP